MLGGKLFAITLGHIVDSVPVKDIVVFPNPETLQELYFSKKITPNYNGYPDIEAEDLRLLAVEADSCNAFTEFKSGFLDIEKIPNNSWQETPEDYEYIAYGFPNVERDIDYEKGILKAKQYLVACTYKGASIVEGCIELSIEQVCGPQDTDGYSGSPVFAWPKGTADLSRTNFCGVAFTAIRPAYTLRVNGALGNKMKYTTAEIEKLIAFVSGYLDAVGRHFTTECVLFSLWAEKGSKRINELSEIDIVGEKKIPEFVHELEQQVGEFLNTDTRERLVFYLLEYLIWFKEFTESFECYKLKVVFEPDERKYLAYKFVVNGSQEVYVFMTQLYKKNA